MILLSVSGLYGGSNSGTIYDGFNDREVGAGCKGRETSSVVAGSQGHLVNSLKQTRKLTCNAYLFDQWRHCNPTYRDSSTWTGDLRRGKVNEQAKVTDTMKSFLTNLLQGVNVDL